MVVVISSVNYEDLQATDSASDDEKKMCLKSNYICYKSYYDKPSTTKCLRYPQIESLNKKGIVVKRNLCVS